MPECIFCQIVKRQLPSQIVAEDAEFVVFRDINPKASVHMLVVPKKHIGSVNELTTTEVDLAGRWVLMAKKVAEKLGIGRAYQIKVAVGKGAGQTVEHLHMHVLGGWDKPQKE